MLRHGAVTVPLGVVFSLALAASAVRADAIHANKYITDLGATKHHSVDKFHNLHLPDVSRGEEHAYLFLAVHSNSGNHFGFSKLGDPAECSPGVVKTGTEQVAPNPEPATMILMGTGLLAVGAAIRRQRRRV
jgi:hypothetical protein